jgi:YVTN family beta-propeller protein/VCBS repeat-containing protein
MSSHRVTNRAKAKKARIARGRHRAPQRHREVATWLGAGALTLGVGAALASGSAVANADSTHTGGSAPTSSSTDSKTGTTGTGSTTTPATKPVPKHSSTVKHSASTLAAGTTDTGPAGVTIGPPAGSSSPTPPALTPAPAALHTAALTTPAPVRTVTPTLSAPTLTTSSVAKPLVTTSSVTKPLLAAALIPAAAVNPPPPVPVSPLENVGNLVIDVLLTVGGMNPADPIANPNNPLQLVLYSLARGIGNRLDPAPARGTPTVTAVDPTTGTVTGSLGFAGDPSGDLTFTTTKPAEGTVTVNSAGDYTYTPTQAARLEAGLNPRVPFADSFTATVHDGVSSNSVTVTVAVSGTHASVVSTIPVGRFPEGVAVTPNGSTVYVVNNGDPETGGSVSVIDTATNTVIKTIPVGQLPITLAINPNGYFVYVDNTGSQTVSVIFTPTNTVAVTIPVTVSGGIAISPTGSPLYVPSEFSESVTEINTATNTVVGTIPIATGDDPLDVAINPSGTRLYVLDQPDASNTEEVSVINTATNAVVATVPVGNFATQLALSPDSTRLYVTNTNDNTVSVINTAFNTVTATIPVGANTGPAGIAVSPDGSVLYVADSGLTYFGSSFPARTVSVINTATNAVIETIPVGDIPGGVAISPDGTHLYVTNAGDNTVSVISLT